MSTRICDSVYIVGGSDLSDPRDCLVYLVDLGELVLIDCGAGPGWPKIADNIRAAGFEPEDLHKLVLTHGHVDHIGAAAMVKNSSNCRTIAHELDCDAIETGDPERTAATWYGMVLKGIPVDKRIAGQSANIEFSAGTLTLIHTPGHTPGSMVAVTDTADGHRVLFGQDIHGPFNKSFGSDISIWHKSMRDLIALDADILCEGHYGVFRGEETIREFIEEQLSFHP